MACPKMTIICVSSIYVGVEAKGREDTREDMEVNADCLASSPSVVVYPSSTEDVVKIVKVAGKYKMPVIPYSGATSLEGHFRAVRHLERHSKTWSVF